MLIFICGTRPEIIKIAPIIQEAEKQKLEYRVLFTNQHYDHSMGWDFLDDFNIKNVRWNEKKLSIPQFIVGQLHIMTKFCNNKVIVQGDTRSAYYGAILAHGLEYPVYHIEAGLRTYDMNNPNPEEFYRTEITKLTDFHFAPTELNKENLIKEGIDENKILVTGNPVIQTLKQTMKTIGKVKKEKQIIITIHRHENKKYIEKIVNLIFNTAIRNPDYNIKVVMHPNNILMDEINSRNVMYKNISFCSPFGYTKFIEQLMKSELIITDSGGIQEECCEIKTGIFVIRETTERPESTFSKLVYPSKLRNNHGLLVGEFLFDSKQKNPYYDKNCIKKIIKVLRK